MVGPVLVLLFGILFGVLLIPLAIIMLMGKAAMSPRRIELPSDVLLRLQELAKRSLESMDVPVGAIVLYDRAVIGEGYNTVLRDHSAGGHAEINAISSALDSIGSEQFAALDRTKLILLSTFEPCLMCVGACIDHNIPTVYYLEAKDAAYLLAEARSYGRYLFRRMRMRNRGEQLALFQLHPLYPSGPKRARE